MAASENSNPSPSRLNQGVLLQSWAQMSVYDLTASQLKQLYLRRRYFVIGISLAATISAVLTGLIKLTVLSSALALVAVAFPIIGAYLMNDIVKFAGTSSWIKYRFTTERMRMHIYLYRMHAGPYAEIPYEEADDRLIDNLKAIRDEVTPDTDIPPLAQETSDTKEIEGRIKQANFYTRGDDGLSEIEVENYIKWRIDSQRDWYDSKIHADFDRWKTFYRAAQGVLLIGSLLGALAGVFDALQLVAVVAITNAVAASMSLWSDVGMTGKTYALFRIASNQLGYQRGKWLALQDNPEFKDPDHKAKEIAALADRIEKVLDWERQEWYELALQSQVATDEMIVGDLKKLAQRAEVAQGGAPASQNSQNQ